MSDTDFRVSVDKLAVRFINDQINRMAVFGRFCFQKSSELLNAFFCVDNAGRIVRGIDEKHLLVCAVTVAERRSKSIWNVEESAGVSIMLRLQIR